MNAFQIVNWGEKNLPDKEKVIQCCHTRKASALRALPLILILLSISMTLGKGAGIKLLINSLVLTLVAKKPRNRFILNHVAPGIYDLY